MKKVRFSELSEQVQQFLEGVKSVGSIAVMDDNQLLVCGVTPYARANEQERVAALRSLEELQKRSAQSMAEYGVTEDDVMREILKDD